MSLASRHIGGSGDKMKPSRTGLGANTRGKPVVGLSTLGKKDQKISELSRGKITDYVRGNVEDQIQHASGQSFRSGLTAHEQNRKYNDADDSDARTKKREQGLERALARLAREDVEYADQLKSFLNEFSSGGTGSASIATVPATGGGTLFGGSYENPANPFTKKSKKTKAIKR
jgi:hypothetical protein